MPTVVTVDTFEPPTLVAYRMENSTTWQTPKTLTPTTFELAVTGPYRVAVVCAEPANGFLGIWQAALTPDDVVPSYLLSCDTQAPAYIVSGTMVQAGSVALDITTEKSTETSWPFYIAASAKTYALIAQTDERIAIQRGLVVAADTTLAAPVDVDASGALLEPAALTVTNAEATETTKARVSLELGNTYTTLHRGELAAAKLAPQSVLEAGDKQIVSVSARSSAGTRYAQRALRVGDPSAFTLPAALGPVVFEVDGQQLTVTWSTLPEYDAIDISLDAVVGDEFRFHDMSVSRKFIEATGITKATIDTASLPGFRPEWRIDTNQEHSRFAGVQRNLSATDSNGSSIYETVNSPSDPAPRRMPMTSALARRLPAFAR